MHVVVCGALVENGAVLLVHRSPTRRAYPDLWDLPGGHVEAGESELQALAREMQLTISPRGCFSRRQVRARVEHVLASMKTWKILRDHRRAAKTLIDTASGIAHLHNIALTW